MRRPPQPDPNLAHRHGGAPKHDQDRLGLPRRPVLDFSVSLNPLGPPRCLREAWPGLLEEAAVYPTQDGDGIRRYYERRFDVPPDEVLPGNGSTEILYLAPRALGLRRVAVPTPSFHDYARAARLAGADVLEIPLSPQDDFAPPPCNLLAEALERADAIILGQPNNPTGTVLPQETIERLSREFPDRWILLDEAFVQFLDDFAETSWLARRPRTANVLVLHSLTKFYALPGLRIGAAVGHPEAIARLRACKEPWSVNRIAETIAPLLDDSDYEHRTRTLVRTERERVFHRLRELPGIRPFPSSANFLLAQWTATPDLDDLLRPLLAEGLHVRDARNFLGLEENYFRLAVRRPEENDLLLDALARHAGACHG
ncbi:MAG: threonine-phosphate decarboxylase CobD [Candidatus Eisenbacteria bacterium]